MKTLLLFLAIAVFTSGAIAQPIDPDADGMGIYFDPDGASIPCIHTGGTIAAVDHHGNGAGGGRQRWQSHRGNPHL